MIVHVLFSFAITMLTSEAADEHKLVPAIEFKRVAAILAERGYRLVRLNDLNKLARDEFHHTYPFRSSPGLLCGHFSVASQDCAALAIRKEHEEKGIVALFVVRGVDKKPSTLLLEDYTDWDGRKDHIFLEFRKQGALRDSAGGHVKQMHFDGFEVVFFEQGSRVYYWDHSRWHTVQTSD